MRFIDEAPPAGSYRPDVECRGVELDQLRLAAAHHQIGGPNAYMEGAAQAGAPDDGNFPSRAQPQGQHTGAQVGIAADGGNAGRFSGGQLFECHGVFLEDEKSSQSRMVTHSIVPINYRGTVPGHR